MFLDKVRVASSYHYIIFFIHLLNTTIRMPFGIMFVMLIEAIVFPLAWEFNVCMEMNSS